MSFTEDLKELLYDTKEYLQLELEELQIKGLYRITKVLSRLFVFLLSSVLFGFMVLFINVWISLYLSQEVFDSLVKGFGAGVGLFVIEIILLYTILQPLLRHIISSAILAEIKQNTEAKDESSQK